MVLEYLLPAGMFVSLFILIFSGFPVAFVLGGIGIAFAGLGIYLDLIPSARLFLAAPRIWGSIGDNLIMVAVPMYIFMGEYAGAVRNR